MIFPIAVLVIYLIWLEWRTNNRLAKLEEAVEGLLLICEIEDKEAIEALEKQRGYETGTDHK